MQGLLRILLVHMRPLNLCLLAGSQFLFAWFLKEEAISWSGWGSQGYMLLVLILASSLLAAAGYLLNDMLDGPADRINNPQKPILNPGNMLWFLYVGLNAIAIFLGWYFLGSRIGILFVWVFSALFLYSLKLKKWPFAGNFIVALLAALSLVCVRIVLPEIPAVSASFYIFFAFAITLLRELVKDAEDIEGDLETGAHTIPALVSERTFHRLIQVLLLLVMVLFLVFVQNLRRYFMGPLEWVMLFYMGLCVFLPLGMLLFRMEAMGTKALYTSISRDLKYIMITGTLSLLLF